MPTIGTLRDAHRQRAGAGIARRRGRRSRVQEVRGSSSAVSDPSSCSKPPNPERARHADSQRRAVVHSGRAASSRRVHRRRSRRGCLHTRANRRDGGGVAHQRSTRTDDSRPTGAGDLRDELTRQVDDRVQPADAAFQDGGPVQDGGFFFATDVLVRRTSGDEDFDEEVSGQVTRSSTRIGTRTPFALENVALRARRQHLDQ